MESQKELETEIGTTEPEMKRLEPKKVTIVKVEIQEVGNKKNRKVVCIVEHPDANDTISISSVNYLKDKKVTNSGLWFNLDKEDKIQKGSALAVFLEKTGSKKLTDLVGKQVDTELEGNYLCFKSY